MFKGVRSTVWESENSTYKRLGVLMKKEILILACMFSILFLAAGVGATVETLGTFKQGTYIELLQSGSNFTFCNISSVRNPDSTSISSTKNVQMTKDINEYNYTLDSVYTDNLGTYIVNGFCSNGTSDIVWAYDFKVTPSGFSNVLGFFIIIIAISYCISFIGFFGKHEWISIIGGLSMMVLGVYVVINGIDVYRNFITAAFSTFTMGLGAIFTLVPLMEILQQNY